MEDRTQSSRFPYGKNSDEAVAYYQTVKEHDSLRKIQQKFPVKVHSTQRAESSLKTCDNDRRPPWTLRDRPPGTNQGPRRRNLGALTLGSTLDVPSDYQNQPGKQAASTKRRTADATGNGKRNNRNDNLFQATPSNDPSSFMTYHPPSSCKQQTEAGSPEDEAFLAVSYPKGWREPQPKLVNKAPKRRKVVSLRKASSPVRS